MGIVHTWDCTRGTSYSVIVSRSYKAYLRMRRDSRFVDAQRPYQNTKIDEDIKPKITIPPIQHAKPRKGIGTSGATVNADKSLHRTLSKFTCSLIRYTLHSYDNVVLGSGAT